MGESAPRIQTAAGGGGSGFLPPGTDRKAAQRIKSKILSYEQLDALINGCRGQFAERDRTMIVTAYGICCRASEVCDLEWGNIQWGERVKFWRRKVKDEWSVQPPARTWKALERWRMRCGPQDREAKVFLSRSGKPLRPEQFSRIVTKAAIRAGLPDNLRGAHITRHSRCAHLLAAGVDMSIVASVAGHSSVSTTSAYVAVQALLMAERASGQVDF